MKKRLVLLFVAVILVLAACGGGSNNSPSNSEGSKGSGKQTEISVLFGKEVMREFEQATKEFGEEHNVKVTVVPLAGANAYEKMTTLYASGNAPTIMSVAQEFVEFQDRLLDLSDEPWVETVHEGMMDFVTVDEKVYGQPATVESFGFIYNKEVLDKVVGGSFDPTTVRTHDEFEDLLSQLEAFEGVDPIHISPMDWSLGAHLTNPLFTAQSDNHEGRHQFMQDMLDGNVSLGENEVFDGWLKTIDLMKEYNNSKHAPLDPTYDDGSLAIATGQVGLWFMGNWAYPDLSEIADDIEYGFLPFPISNNPEDYGNSQISVGVPSYWVIDESQSSEAEQEAAKEFLNWLVSTEKGQEHYVNGLNFIPVYEGFSVQPKDSLSLATIEYMEENNTLEWMNSYYPADGFPTMGASLQKYISDAIDREELIQEFETYWENAK